jgi:cation:H+ antiporter
LIISSILLVVGFVLLVKGADFFLNGASALGVKFKMPQIVIGLTIVAFGTSLPELFINIIGSVQKNNDIILGNIIGSNIFNILIILGISALIYPIRAKRNTVLKEVPFVVLTSIILLVLANDELFGESLSILSRGDGIILLIGMLYFLRYLYKLSKKESCDDDIVCIKSEVKIGFYIAFGLAGLIIGGNFVVNSAVDIAKFFGVSDKIIALTIISIGTGLPELVTSIMAVLRKNSGIAIGNIVGSNIFNTLLVIGTSIIIHPVTFSSKLYLPDFLMMIFASIVLFVVLLVFKVSTIKKSEGIIMILLYIVYMAYNFYRI